MFINISIGTGKRKSIITITMRSPRYFVRTVGNFPYKHYKKNSKFLQSRKKSEFFDCSVSEQDEDKNLKFLGYTDTQRNYFDAINYGLWTDLTCLRKHTYK